MRMYNKVLIEDFGKFCEEHKPKIEETLRGVFFKGEDVKTSFHYQTKTDEPHQGETLVEVLMVFNTEEVYKNEDIKVFDLELADAIDEIGYRFYDSVYEIVL